MKTTTDLRPLHTRALESMGAVIARVRPGDLTRPTPCADWDLNALIGHIVGQQHGFAAAVETSDAPLSAYAVPTLEPGEILTAWTSSAERLTAAFATAPLDRAVLMAEFSAEIRFPVATLVGFHLLDTVVHTWDVSTALGEPFRPDDELMAATLAVAEQVPAGEARERPDAPFAAVLPDDGADDWAHALAWLGRQ